MRTTQAISVTLPLEMAQMVKAKVATGEYASDSEVVRDGLRALLARDKVVEKWLTEIAVPAANEMKSNPKSSLSIDEVKTSLADHIAARKQAKGL